MAVLWSCQRVVICMTVFACFTYFLTYLLTYLLTCYLPRRLVLA